MTESGVSHQALIIPMDETRHSLCKRVLRICSLASTTRLACTGADLMYDCPGMKRIGLHLFPGRGHHAVGGYFIVDLPIDRMRANINNENKYYLQITDENGKIIKDDYFLFILYTP